jgi:uncharacterized protein YjbJ (UPF0337 family)
MPRGRQAARVCDGGRRHPNQQMKESDVKSARDDRVRSEVDRIRGDVDKLTERVLEAFGKVTDNRSTSASGRVARAREAIRPVQGRFKRHVD